MRDSRAVRGVLAQRLVRRVCAGCLEEYAPDSRELDALGIEGDDRDRTLQRGRGCDKCNNTGYRGRTGIFSLVEMTEAVGKAVKGRQLEGIVAAARESGWRSLREAALERMWRGETTAEEVLRMT